MNKLTVVGRSHMVSLVKAYEAPKNQDYGLVEFINTRGHEPIWSDWSDVSSITDGFRQILDSAGEESGYLALILQGNQHSMLSILKHETKFDFVLNEMPHMSVDKDATLIPESLIEFWYRNSLRELEVVLAHCSNSNKFEKIFVLSPPPPIYSNDVIANRLDGYFDLEREDYFLDDGKLIVNDPNIRWKCWRLQHSIYKDIAEVYNADFIEIPTETVDNNGFLLEPAWGADATHANEWYGDKRLRQIFKIIADFKKEDTEDER